MTSNEGEKPNSLAEARALMISKDAEKSNLLAKAQALPARDAIVLLRITQWRPGGRYPRLSIEDVVPNASEADTEAANRLVAKAASYGDRWWSAEPGEGREAVDRLMRDENPGFLESTYREASLFGSFLAR